MRGCDNKIDLKLVFQRMIGGMTMFDVASIEETKQTFGDDVTLSLYDEFVEETADENGEVDNNYYPIWLKERLSR